MRGVVRFRDAPVLQPQEQTNQGQEEDGGVVLQEGNSSFGAGQEQHAAGENENQGAKKRSTEPGRTKEACVRSSLGWNHRIDSPEPMLSPGMMRANSPAGARSSWRGYHWVTVRLVVPEALEPFALEVAVMVVEPVLVKVARPGLLVEKVATLVLDELQVVDDVTF